jgi:hypothetical protein
MVDRYGHFLQRLNAFDGALTGSKAKTATAQHESEYGRVGGPPGALTIDVSSDKGLQVVFTVYDPKVFTTPWSAAVTYLHTTTEWSEYICAESAHDYFSGTTAPVPVAQKPDF